MRINKRYIITLIATIVLSVPAIHLKALSQDSTSSDTKPQLSLAIVQAAQEEQDKKAAEIKASEDAKIAELEKQRVAAIEAAQAAEAEKQRVAAEEAQKAAVAAAEAAQCGPHDASVVYAVLREVGMSHIGAVQQTGSWKWESGGDFNQCQTRGDGGVAHGLNSWHPGRRYDMPMNLHDQIVWAVTVEMPRDCAECHQILMNPAVSVSAARSAIQKSTRWGEVGQRWIYADQLMSIL